MARDQWDMPVHQINFSGTLAGQKSAPCAVEQAKKLSIMGSANTSCSWCIGRLPPAELNETNASFPR
jgi:hypothetical protein